MSSGMEIGSFFFVCFFFGFFFRELSFYSHFCKAYNSMYPGPGYFFSGKFRSWIQKESFHPFPHQVMKSINIYWYIFVCVRVCVVRAHFTIKENNFRCV